MKRGIITFSPAEIDEIVNRIDLDTYTKSPIKNKILAGQKSDINEIPVEVSEEELEYILDEIIIPDPQKDSEATVSLRGKIQTLLSDFRNMGGSTI